MCVCVCTRQGGRKGKASRAALLTHSLKASLLTHSPVGTSILVCVSREALTTVAAQYLSEHRPANTHCKPITTITLFTPAAAVSSSTTEASFQHNQRDIIPENACRTPTLATPSVIPRVPPRARRW